jgi:hypothetical protein
MQTKHHNPRHVSLRAAVANSISHTHNPVVSAAIAMSTYTLPFVVIVPKRTFLGAHVIN